MAKILYSINGDGLGHVNRSIPIIQELSKTHKIKILVGSKRAFNYIKTHYPTIINKCTEISGPKIIYKDNSVSDFDTAKFFIKEIAKNSSKNFRIVFSTIKKFNPDLIITDFEPSTAYISNIFRKPTICLCNVHSITHLKYDVPKKYLKTSRKIKLITRSLVPRVDYHFITTFFYLPVKKSNVELFPPVLRPEIVKLKTKRKNYILVYQTSSTNYKLIETLKSIKYKFVVYGFDKEKVEDNITFRKTNTDIFYKDFSECSGCIANGGFTFISEAISLHKPVFSIPIKGQFEQILNALQVKRLGYGTMADEASKNSIIKFIKDLDKYHNNLKEYTISDNGEVIKRINEIIIENKK